MRHGSDRRRLPVGRSRATIVLMLRYRPCVAAIVQDAVGQVLLCERADFPGCWQVPQGGRHEGETAEEALRREVEEEVSLCAADYRIAARHGPYRYRFPRGLRSHGCDGQEQIYFLLRLEAPRTRVNVDTPAREFRSVRWIDPAELDTRWLPPMKVAVYRQVWKDCFGLDLP